MVQPLGRGILASAHPCGGERVFLPGTLVDFPCIGAGSLPVHHHPHHPYHHQPISSDWSTPGIPIWSTSGMS
eukprot:7007503-Prymnesium_polylepis.1